MYREINNVLTDIAKLKKTLTHQSFVEAVRNELCSFFEFLSTLEEFIRNLSL